jgi:signal peptidase I
MNKDFAPRRPWLAAIFSAVLPGFGQFYVGEANRALGFFLAFMLLQIPFLIMVSLFLPIGFTAPAVLLSTVVSIGIWIFGIVDAWRLARRLNPFVPAAWQTRTVYLTVFLLTVFVLLPSVIGYVRSNLVQAFRIPSGSMKPTLLPGDMLFADMRYNCIWCKNVVQRGDVAIFVYPNNRTFHYVKRIIGLPDDTVEINKGQLKVNDKVVEDGFDIDKSVNMSLRTVAPGHVFVLGDNRNASNDSRKFGEVPISDVVARPRQIWFSLGEDGIRWDRIGQAVQGGS